MASRYKVRFRRDFNIGRVVTKIGVTILALWVGGFFIQELGNTMTGTCSAFYKGLTLIGWEIGNNATSVAAGVTPDASCVKSNNIVYDTSGSGVLTVVGLVGIGTIVMEFVEFRMGG